MSAFEATIINAFSYHSLQSTGFVTLLSKRLHSLGTGLQQGVRVVGSLDL